MEKPLLLDGYRVGRRSTGSSHWDLVDCDPRAVVGGRIAHQLGRVGSTGCTRRSVHPQRGTSQTWKSVACLFCPPSTFGLDTWPHRTGFEVAFPDRFFGHAGTVLESDSVPKSERFSRELATGSDCFWRIRTGTGPIAVVLCE